MSKRLDGGKGSSPRPFSVSNAEYASRWDAIFGKDINTGDLCPACGARASEHGSGLVHGIETTWRICSDCGHQWDAQ